MKSPKLQYTYSEMPTIVTLKLQYSNTVIRNQFYCNYTVLPEQNSVELHWICCKYEFWWQCKCTENYTETTPKLQDNLHWNYTTMYAEITMKFEKVDIYRDYNLGKSWHSGVLTCSNDNLFYRNDPSQFADARNEANKSLKRTC